RDRRVRARHPDRVVDHHGRQPAVVEAGVGTGVAGRALLVHLQQQRVTVTVQPDLADPLPVPAGLPLDPVLAPAAGPERRPAGGQRAPQRLVVHPADHQHVTGALLLDDGGDQAVRVALQRGGDVGGQFAVGRSGGVGRGFGLDVGHGSIVAVVTGRARTGSPRDRSGVLAFLPMTFAKSERAALCDLFDEVGPGAPGLLVRPRAGRTERRMAETKQRWEYAELVDRLRHGPARLSVFAIPGIDDAANTTEFFVHHEDVRRAGEVPLPHRELGEEVEDWMWRRLKLLGRAFFRRAPVGVVLELAGSVGEAVEPETIGAGAGSS